MEKLNIDLNVLEETLVNFLKEEVGKVGFNKVVLGLSGGIDSDADIADMQPSRDHTVGTD